MPDDGDFSQVTVPVPRMGGGIFAPALLVETVVCRHSLLARLGAKTLRSSAALASIQQRIASCEQDGLMETARFLRHLEAGLSGAKPVDEVAIVASMAAAMERIERRLAAVEATSRAGLADHQP